MIRRKKLQLGIVALILVITNNVKSEEICRHRCEAPSGNQQLKYQPRTTYTYDFTSDLDLTLPNAKGQSSKTQVKATVFLTPQSGCSYVLQLQNFRIIGGNAQTYENIDGIEKPVTFQYLNGAIGTDICVEQNDPSHSLNVKRAIISSFQLNSYGHQTDVFGVCPTESVVERKDDGETYIRRMRNLNKCDKRENLEQNFMAETLKDKKILESVPILTSDYVSLQNLNGGILQTVSIFENYTYMASKPSDGSKIQASVKSYLRYTGITGEMLPYITTTQTKSIIFDKTPTVLHKYNTNVIGDTLQLFLRDEMVLSEDSSRNFLNLVNIMRDSSKDDLLSVYKHMQAQGFNDYIRKVFINALLRCGTSAALTAGLELVSNKQLNSDEEKKLYFGFSYVRNPTTEVVKVAADLLAANRLPKETYLGIGNLVRRYCEQRICPDSITSEITSIFERKLIGNATRHQKIEIVYILKALSNVGHLPEETSRIILALAQNPQNNAHIRSVALDTLTTTACRDEVRNNLLYTLQNIEEDSEIRIKSYLVLTKCPNLYVAQVIESMINNEPTNQVGSFITSHVKSLTNILSTINIQKTFPQDSRKYSFNAESVHDFVGMKHKTSSNVIYSQKSFLPRFANLNVTADVLGTNVNLFEIEIRQENFDRMLEHYFGPVGTSQHNDELKNVKKYINGPDLDLDVNVKLFGSDFLFFSLNDEPKQFTDTFVQFLVQDLQSKMNFDSNRQQNMIFIDSQLSYPTSLGFPLRLSVEGVFSIQFREHSYAMLRQRKLEFLPSVNVEITSSIGVDARVVESGIKVVSKVHVATGVVVEGLSNGENGEEIKLSLPLQEQKASFSHDIYLNVREMGERDSLTPLRFSNNDAGSQCIDRVAEATGLELCFNFNVPPSSANYYLSGNYKSALTLNSTDFSHLSLKQEFNDQKEIHLSARIVGRRQDTKTGLIVDASLNDGYMVRITGVLPKHNASIEARLNNTISEKSVYMEVQMDHQKFFGKFGIGINQMPNKIVYSPLVYVAIPSKYGQHYPLNTKGSVVIYNKEDDLKITLEDLQLILQKESEMKIYSVNGRLGRDKHGYFSELMVSDGRTIIQTGEKLRIYKNKLKVSGYLTNNYNPDLNLHINYEFLRKPVLLHSFLEIVHGPDAKSKINCLTIKDIMMLKSDKQNFEMRNRITYPAAEFDVKGDFVSNVLSTLFDVEFKHGQYVYGTKLDAKYQQKDIDDYDVSLIAYDAHNQIGITGSRVIQGGTNTVNHTFFINKALFELSGQIILPKMADRTHSMKLILKTPDQVPIYISGRAYQDNQNGEYSLLVNDVVNKYIDFKLSSGRTSNNFDMLVFVQNVIKFNAHFTNGDTNGDGDLFIDLFEDYSIKLDLIYSMTSIYYLKTTLYPNFRKQPTFAMSFTTNTQNEPHIFNSRNLFEVSGQTYADVNVKYSNLPGAMMAEVELVTKDDASGSVKFQSTGIGGYNFTDVAYEVSVKSRNFLEAYHDTVRVRFETNSEVNKRYRKTLFASIDSKCTGPVHLNTSFYVSYDKPWTNSLGVMFKLYPHEEIDGVNLQAALKNIETELWNFVVSLKAFRNYHDVFLNGTYKDEGHGTPITLNLTGNVKTELFNREFDNLKINSSMVFTPPLHNRYYNIKSDTQLFVVGVSGWNSTRKFHAVINVGPEDGTILMSSQYDDHVPAVLTSNYSLHYLQQYNEATFNFDFNDGNYPVLSANAIYVVNQSQCDLVVQGRYVYVPMLLRFGVKEIEYGIAYDAYGLFQVEDNKYDLVGQVSMAADTPKLNIEIKHGVTDQFLIEMNYSERGVVKGNMKVSMHYLPFLLENKWTYENCHKFVFYHAHHCPALQAEHFKMHLSNVPTRLSHIATDTLHYNITILEDNIITGSTNFSITTMDRNRSYNCTSLIRLMKDVAKEYSAEYQVENGLQRISTKFHEHTMETTLRIDHKTVSVTHSFCDQKKPCFQIRATRENRFDGDKMEFYGLLLVDSRFFGGHKIDLKHFLMVSPQVYNLTGEAIFNDYTKYVSTYLVQDDAVSLSFETPHRHIFLKRHKSFKDHRPETLQVDFYPNKFHTQHKTSLRVVRDCVFVKCKMEMRLADPNLPRDLVVAYAASRYQMENVIEENIIFDIFKREEDKIIFSSKTSQNQYSRMILNEIKSQGLDFNFNYLESTKVQMSPEPMFDYVYNTQFQFGKHSYNNGFVIRTNTKETLLNVTVFNNNVFMINTQVTGSAKKTKINTDVKIIGADPIYACLETKNFNSLNLTVWTKGNTKDAFQLTAKLFGEDIARIQATKNNQTLSATSLRMQWNNLMYNYKYDALSIERTVLKPAKREADYSIQVFKDFFAKVKEELNQHWRQLDQTISGSIPDFEPTLLFYKNEINSFKNELRADQVLHELVPIIGFATDTIFDVAQITITEAYEIGTISLSTILEREQQQIYSKLLLSKDIEEIIYNALIDLNYLMGKYEKQVQDFGNQFFNTIEEAFIIANTIKFGLIEGYKTFKNSIVFNKFTDGLTQVSPPSENLIKNFKEMINNLKTNTTSIEMIKLLDLLGDYSEKKLRNEDVEDDKALDEISDAFGDVVNVIYNNEDDSLSWQTLSTLFELGYLEAQMGLDHMQRWYNEANLFTRIAVSEYKMKEFPKDFTGIITQNHVFTFDGKHITLHGDCNVLLMEDMLDGNFTLTANYSGSIASLAFNDKHSKVFVNNNGEFSSRTIDNDFMPSRGLKIKEDVDHFTVKSKYGVELKCDFNLITCIVKVSGYYHAHLKGILGTANNEPYDDFILPNGRITTNIREFVTSYTTPKCEKVQAPTNVPQYPKCTQLFAQPEFRQCSKIIDTNEYQTACNEGLHLGIDDIENVITRAYAAICHTKGINIRLHTSEITNNFIIKAE